MTIRTTDLDKFDQVMTMVNGWIGEMDALGIDLMGIRFQIRNRYYNNELSYNKDALPEPFWDIT